MLLVPREVIAAQQLSQDSAPDAPTAREKSGLGIPFLGQTQVWTRAERSAAGLMEYNCRYIRVPPAVRAE
jgi:hypothetical protein